MGTAHKPQRLVRVRRVEADSEDASWDFWDQGTPEERMETVWEIVLDCMELRGEGRESRLRRDAVRLKRPRR